MFGQIEPITPFKKELMEMAPADMSLGQILTLQLACIEFYTENEKLRAALGTIEALSHCWIIKESTAHIEAPIHEKYRAIAHDALAEKERGEQ